MIDPELLALLQAAAPPPPGDATDVRAARAAFAASAPVASLVPSLTVSDVVIDATGGPLRVRRYQPGQQPADTAIVYAHGGGWCLGSIETHDLQARLLAAATELDVVSVDYRLAPEHRFPAGLDDVRRTVEHVLHTGLTGAPPYRRVVLAGDSAGANLAAATARRAAGDGRVCAQLLNYGVFDLTRRYPVGFKALPGPALDGPRLRWFIEQYVPDPDTAASPDASPLLAGDFAGVCPTVLAGAALDILAGETTELAGALRAHGVQVVHLEARTLGHGYLLYVDRVRAARQALADSAAALSRLLVPAP